MGMAASQARHLALVARKSNCEYEGQQINQARTALANQSANLFNQMLGLSVPIPPSTQDFTKTQYSFTDGINGSTIDSWQQLATTDENYNYVVTHHSYQDVYTGAQKMMNDPQVQFVKSPDLISPDYSAQVAVIQTSLEEVAAAEEAYKAADARYNSLVSDAAYISYYKDSATRINITNSVKNDDGSYSVTTKDTVPVPPHTVTVPEEQQEKHTVDGVEYPVSTGSDGVDYYFDGTNYISTADNTTLKADDVTVTPKMGTVNVDYEYPIYTGSDGVDYYFDGTKYISTADNTTEKADDVTVAEKTQAGTLEYVYAPYESMTDDVLKARIANAITTWNNNGCKVEGSDVFYDAANDAIVLRGDLEALISEGTSGTATILPQYYIDDASIPADLDPKPVSINGMKQAIDEAKANVVLTKGVLDVANATLESHNMPEYIGNCALTALGELTPDQEAEIAQIIKDMEKLDVDTNFDKYYNINSGEYIGGIYQFKLNGITYYTTYDDLANSALSGEGINHIDNQDRLAYYNASYVSTKIEETEKALLETDAQGRFVSVRLENDTVTYQLNMETVTDDVAYEDAMNQYYYENAKYDKMIQDINAQTSIIQQQDQQLELRLKQLDTEHNALSAEIDAVSKVVKDNVDKSFKTFGG